MDCRIAAGRLFKALTRRKHGLKRNRRKFRRIGVLPHGEIHGRPAQFPGCNGRRRRFRETLFGFRSGAKVLRVINPHMVDRKGVPINAVGDNRGSLGNTFATTRFSTPRSWDPVARDRGRGRLRPLTDSYLDRSAKEKCGRLLIQGWREILELDRILAVIAREYPDIRTELDYETPFQFLVAVMLSAQTTDKQVNKVTPRRISSSSVRPREPPSESRRKKPETLASRA